MTNSDALGLLGGRELTQWELKRERKIGFRELKCT